MSIISIFLLGMVGLATFTLYKMDMDELIMCSVGEGGFRLPEKVCESFMRKFRTNKVNIDSLNNGAGIDAILNLSNNEKKYTLAEYFLSKGLDINGINHYGEANLTPIHAAILYNDFVRVEFLVKHRADLNIKDPRYNMTPLEFAKSLQENRPEVDRGKIISLLEK